MTLTDQIQRERKAIDGYETAIKEAREKLWDANFVRKNDERRKGESDEHWERRRKRNRTAYENRDEAVEHLKKKLDAHRKLLERIKDKKEDLKDSDKPSQGSGGYQKGGTRIMTMDGKPIVEDIAYWLSAARQKGWSGVVVSGYRSPAYSVQLCFGICGSSSCPGRCAGASSNHAKTTYGGPAADVTDYINCERVLQSIGAPYFNNLPMDLVHMSRSGA